MLARTPSVLLRGARRPVPVRKLSRGRRIAIRDTLVAMMHAAEPTQFAVEGPCRAGIRASLCLQGWTWGQADAEAALIVLSALATAGARRPTWQQGQPEYCQDGHVPQARERCVRCAKPLPEGNYRFCGSVCAQAAKVDRNRKRDREALLAQERAARAAWTARQPEQHCKSCERAFRPKHVGAKFCSHQCSLDARRFGGRKMRLVCEAVHDDTNR